MHTRSRGLIQLAVGVFLVGGLLASPAGITYAAEDRYTIEIHTASSLRVRSAVWGTILGHVGKGQRFVANRSARGWYEIDWHGRRAWVSGHYARRASASAKEITANRLNVRSGPSTGYRIVGRIPRGQAYTTLRTSGSWTRIQFDGAQRWVFSSYLRPMGSAPTPAPTPTPPPTTLPLLPPPTPTPSGVDAQLAAIQAAAMKSARAELAAGVIEVPYRSNRGPRVDVYASTAGMRTGLAWCGFFANFNWVTAGRAQGLEFSGRRRLHSVEKSRDWFNYRSYTQRWTSERVVAWEAERAAHRAQGNTRVWMALRGSAGHRYSTSRNLPARIFDTYRDLSIRPGDMVLWPRHMALCESYDRASGRLVTVDGNWSHRVIRRTHQLSSASVRDALLGFGRPARGDFR